MTNPNDDKAMSPKANEGKALTAEEAIGWTRIRLSNLRASQMEKHLDTSPCCRSYFTQPDRDKDLAALATLEALAEENEKVKAESSQWRVLYNLWEAECGKLKAEVEQNKALITDLTRDMNEEHDRAEKAEAELARYRRFDPLIEAAESDGEFSVVGGTSPVADKIIRAVVNLRAALKCREKAIPESNNQSGSSQSDHKPAEK